MRLHTTEILEQPKTTRRTQSDEYFIKHHNNNYNYKNNLFSVFSTHRVVSDDLVDVSSDAEHEKSDEPEQDVNSAQAPFHQRPAATLCHFAS